MDRLDRSGRSNQSDYTVDGLRSLRASRMFELAARGSLLDPRPPNHALVAPMCVNIE